MRRDRSDHRYLKALLLFGAGIVYEPVAMISGYLTPLIGFWFYFLLRHIDNSDYRIRNLLIFLYLLYVEIDRGFIPFSFLLLFFWFYTLFYRFFEETVICKPCLIILYISIGYLGYYLWNLFLASLLHLPLPDFGLTYLLYILSDILLGWWLL